MTDDESVNSALATIGSAEGRLDVLVHNAGILGHGVADGPTALQVFDTNAVGVVRVTEAALPLLRKSSNPTIEPGFTATDMTEGFEGGRTPEESAGTIVRLATLATDGPTGTFSDEAGELRW